MQVFFTKDRNDKSTDQVLKMITDDEQILFVPKDEQNRHFQEIQAWIAEGNEIQEAEEAE